MTKSATAGNSNTLHRGVARKYQNTATTGGRSDSKTTGGTSGTIALKAHQQNMTNHQNGSKVRRTTAMPSNSGNANVSNLVKNRATSAVNLMGQKLASVATDSQQNQKSSTLATQLP